MLHNNPSTSDSQLLDLTPFTDQDENATWENALRQFDNNMLMSALHEFQSLPQTSKVLFNCGVIFQLLERYKIAVWISKLRQICLNKWNNYWQVKCYSQAIGLDPYFAVAYFQLGILHFSLEDFKDALIAFNNVQLLLRGNSFIDYSPLGLDFTLYSCENLFNRGLCFVRLKQKLPGLQDFDRAIRERMRPHHDLVLNIVQPKNVRTIAIPVLDTRLTVTVLKLLRPS